MKDDGKAKAGSGDANDRRDKSYERAQSAYAMVEGTESRYLFLPSCSRDSVVGESWDRRGMLFNQIQMRHQLPYQCQ